jgi:hypothetical protein
MYIKGTPVMTLITLTNVIITDVKNVEFQRALLHKIIMKLIKNLLHFSILATSIWFDKNF